MLDQTTGVDTSDLAAKKGFDSKLKFKSQTLPSWLMF